MSKMYLGLTLVLLVVVGGLWSQTKSPTLNPTLVVPTLPAEAHAKVPAGVELTKAAVDDKHYTTYFLQPVEQHFTAFAVIADAGYVISKAGMRYDKVMLLPNELANIRQISDGQAVSAIKNARPLPRK